jgi:hypothetical protein
MNGYVNSINVRLSLRPLQHQSLEILHGITEIGWHRYKLEGYSANG